MATTTPKLSLKKPVPNVETDWAFRLNETIDLLDDAVFTANVTEAGNVTVTDDGSGNVTISGSDPTIIEGTNITVASGTNGITISSLGGSDTNDVSNAMVGSDGITVTSGDPIDTIEGFHGEFVLASGSLSSEIDSDISTHAGDTDAHHVKYTNAEAITALEPTTSELAASGVALDSGKVDITGDTMSGNLAFTAGTVTVGGIQNQNLLDKTATESITGAWDYDATNAIFQIDGGTDLSLADATSGYFVIGDTGSTNIAFDNNEIMARNNGAINTLNLQTEGGILSVHTNNADVSVFQVLDNGDIISGTFNSGAKMTIGLDTGTAIAAGGSTVAMFHNSSSSGDSAVIDIIAGTSSVAGIALGDTGSRTSGYVRYNNAVDEMQLWTNGGVSMLINNLGHMTVGKGTAGDSIVNFKDAGSLVFAMGHDATESKLIIANGVADTTNDLMTFDGAVVDILPANTVRVTFADTTMTFASAYDIVLDTTTGTKIGTATSQKLAFYNSTPIIQITTGVAEAAFTANAGTAVNDDSTFGGYTLQQIAQALQDLGLLA